MSDTNITKYVGDVALKAYDPKIKAWFENQVNQVTFIEPVYHEDSRTLEFVEMTGSVVSE